MRRSYRDHKLEDDAEAHQDQKKGKALEADDVGGHDAAPSRWRVRLSAKIVPSDVIAITS
jgi:hypothetical protein